MTDLPNMDDLEAKARALTYRGGDEQVLALDAIALIARLREAEAKLPPCDGGCSYDSGPEETCSAHGRLPAEIWELVSRIAAERDVAQGQLGEAEHVIARILDYDGPEAADMRDIALTYKPNNQEKGEET